LPYSLPNLIFKFNLKPNGIFLILQLIPLLIHTQD
jgi:hypothetical protein